MQPDIKSYSVVICNQGTFLLLMSWNVDPVSTASNCVAVKNKIYRLIQLYRAYDNSQSSDISGQIEHLSGHTEFGQTNLLYIINREAIEFTKENQMSGQFSVLIISTVIGFMLIISVQSTCHLKLHNYTDPNQTVLEAVYIRHNFVCHLCISGKESLSLGMHPSRDELLGFLPDLHPDIVVSQYVNNKSLYNQNL